VAERQLACMSIDDCRENIVKQINKLEIALTPIIQDNVASLEILK
jgi:hypothetical protein